MSSFDRRRLSSTASQSTADALEALVESPPALVWTLTFVASISGFLFGYDTGYISSVLVSIGTDLGGQELTIKQREFISSATSFGALVSSLFAGLLADLIGRKYTVMLCDSLFILGTAIQFFTYNVNMMIIGRLIMGLGVGIGSLCAPLYISELSPSKFRGRLVTINCLAITGGQLIAYAIGAVFSNLHNGWRIIVGISFVPSFIQLISMFFLSDTPRYLIMKDKYIEASDILKQIYPNASDNLIHMNIEELQIINNLCDDDKSILTKFKTALKELFSKNSNKRSLIIACGLQASQQFVGFNALMYFSSSIFEMVGFRNSTFVSCFVAGTNFLTTIIALFLIDKIGRRKILLYSIPLLFLSQLLCSLSFYCIDNNTPAGNGSDDKWKYILLLSLILFVAFYSIGLGNVPWQQSELFPQKIRGLGSSFATSTNWFGSMILSFFFLSLVKLISSSFTFLLFSINTLISFVFVYYLYPELSGLPLEQVQNLLDDGFNVQKSIQIHNNMKNHNSNNNAYQLIINDEY